MEKINLLGLNKIELEKFFISIDEKPFRATQIIKWIHQRGVSDFTQMTDLSKDLRAKLEIHCVDSWAGGIEHNGQIDMPSVEARFDRNTSKLIRESPSEVNLVKHKGYSDIILSRLLADGYSGYFDFVYVDGSHQAPDVLLDSIMAFKLVKIGGLIGFDDYTWAESLSGGRDPLRCPKIAIDSFTNIFFRKLEYLNAPISQIYLKKLAN